MTKRVILEIVIAMLFAVAAVSLTTAGVMGIKYLTLVNQEKKSQEGAPSDSEKQEGLDEEESKKEDEGEAAKGDRLSVFIEDNSIKIKKI